MNLLEKYLKASFRGVEFSCTGEKTTEGRKIVTHEFVNSDKRIDEDLGAFPPVFTLRAFVHGNDAFAQTANLRRVLNMKGRGDLIHPTRGRVLVTAKQYTINTSNRTTGRVDFVLTFDSTEAPDVQQVNLVTPQVFAGHAKEVRDLAAKVAAEKYVMPRDEPHSVALGELLQEEMENTVEVVREIPDAPVATIEVEEIIKRPRALLSEPKNLFPKLQSIFEIVAGAGGVNAWIKAADKAPSVPKFKGDTRRGMDQNKSFGAISSTISVNTLINGYESAVNNEFDTVTELNSAEDRLNKLFNEVVGEAGPDSIAKDPDMRAALLRARVTAKQLLNLKEQQVWKVKPIDTVGRGFATTAYMLYESHDELELISRLNRGLNANHPAGPIQVLSR